MGTVQADANSRVFFFDNIRYFLVLIVVFFHSLLSYTAYMDGWTINDENFFSAVNIVLILDALMMPCLFFIAGYFALISHKGQTTWKFIKKKLFHLGIPWLIGVILVNPFQMYLKLSSRGSTDLGLWDCFLIRMKSALSLTFDAAVYRLYEDVNLFSHLYFWFVSLLLFFFIVFALIKKLKRLVFKNSSSRVKSESASTVSIFAAISIAVLMIFVLDNVMYTVFPMVMFPNKWMLAGIVLQFQFIMIVKYVVCFSLGIYACHKKWFSNQAAPGHPFVWIVLTIVLGFTYRNLLFSLLEDSTLVKGLSFLLLHPVFIFSVLLMLISVGVKYWNSDSKTNRLLADNSYNIYLIHMVFVYLSQWALKSVPMIPAYVKPFIVFGVAVSASLLVSHFAIRKSRGLSVAGMVGLFVLMSVLMR